MLKIKIKIEWDNFQSDPMSGFVCPLYVKVLEVRCDSLNDKLDIRRSFWTRKFPKIPP